MTSRALSIPRLLLRSITVYWRVQLSLLLATAVGMAVLTGALLVGDSMRASLRTLAVEGLGEIDNLLLSDTFFRESLAAQLGAAPIIVQPGSAYPAEGDYFAGEISVLAVDERFWGLGATDNPFAEENDFAVALNRALADALQVVPGEDILLRVQRPSPVPRETFLGKKEDTVETLRLQVTRILENRDLARFSLRPSQQTPLNAFLPLETLQRYLQKEGSINAAAMPGEQTTLKHRLQRYAQPADAGWRFRMTDELFTLQSTRVFLRPQTTRLARESAPEATPAFAYMVNAIQKGERSIPYSMALAVTPPWLEVSPGMVRLNAWAMEDLKAEQGDTVLLRYYVEGRGGLLEEAETTFTLGAVVPMASPVVDDVMTPRFEGISDAESLADWDPPFPLDLNRIRPQDDTYWEEYRAAPKVFLHIEDARNIWRHPHGNTTGLLWPGERAKATRQALRERFNPIEAGLDILPLRERALQASEGTTDFGSLFLGFSLFILLAAAMLIQALFRLSLEDRQKQYGLLLAVGFTRFRALSVHLSEGAMIALAAAALGLPGGIAYGRLMVYGLNHWWVGAIGNPFLVFDARWGSLLFGPVGGWFLAMAAMIYAAWGLRGMSVRHLLAGTSRATLQARGRGRVSFSAGLAFLVIALVLLVSSQSQPAHAQVTFFFASGALLLLSGLAFLRFVLVRPPKLEGRPLSLTRFGLANARRQPDRSLLVVGLVATAAFLIVAVGANRHQADLNYPGAGGYDLRAESAIPLYRLPQKQTLRDQEARELLQQSELHAMRLKGGDNPSCLNLYQAMEPRVAAVDDPFIQRGGFVFTGVSRLGDFPKDAKENPWLLLKGTFPDGAIPAIGDYTTVLWLLHKGLGQDIVVSGQRLRIVGLLKKSIFQGELLIYEPAFRKAFPEVAGWKLFVVDAPPKREAELMAALEGAFRRQGLDAVATSDQLNALMEVENTYLSTFLTLGGLGLMLGVVGLGFALFRNLLERRSELALMEALGIRRTRLFYLAVIENTGLIVTGLLLGAACAIVAMWPALKQRMIEPPWQSITEMMALILLAGLLSTLVAAGFALRGNLVQILKRGE